MARRAGGERGREGENQSRWVPWLGINPDRSMPGGASWREFIRKVDDVRGARVRYRRSQPPPPFSYAVTLELLEGGKWHTVRLWDNADGLDEHHEHAYTREEDKQPPAILEFASTNEAMASAIDNANRKAAELVRQWRSS